MDLPAQLNQIMVAGIVLFFNLHQSGKGWAFFKKTFNRGTCFEKAAHACPVREL